MRSDHQIRSNHVRLGEIISDQGGSHQKTASSHQIRSNYISDQVTSGQARLHQISLYHINKIRSHEIISDEVRLHPITSDEVKSHQIRLFLHHLQSDHVRSQNIRSSRIISSIKMRLPQITSDHVAQDHIR